VALPGVKKGKLDKALADYTSAIALSPRYALAYNNRGYVYESQGKSAEARADFIKALSIDRTLSGAGAGLKRLGAGAVVTSHSDILVSKGSVLVETNCVTCLLQCVQRTLQTGKLGSVRPVPA